MTESLFSTKHISFFPSCVFLLLLLLSIAGQNKKHRIYVSSHEVSVTPVRLPEYVYTFYAECSCVGDLVQMLSNRTRGHVF